LNKTTIDIPPFKTQFKTLEFESSLFEVPFCSMFLEGCGVDGFG